MSPPLGTCLVGTCYAGVSHALATAGDTWMLVRFAGLVLVLVFNIVVLIRMGYRRNPRVTRWVLAILCLAVVGVVVALVVADKVRAREWERKLAAEQAEAETWRRAEEARVARLTPAQLAAERASRVNTALFRYWVAHHRYPLTLWSDLTSRDPFTDTGPYLPEPVENPVTHSSTAEWRGFVKPTDGWEYDEHAGRVWPVGVPRETPGTAPSVPSVPSATTAPTGQTRPAGP